MDLGKLDKQQLNKLFAQKLGKTTNKIIQGSSFGVDTAIIRINQNKCLITSSDPASFIPSLGVKESAWLTVILTANDIATSGYLPQYAQFVLNLTHTMNKDKLTQYWNYIHQFCSEIGISITGGHTGFDDIGNSTLAGGTTMFTIGDIEAVKTSAFAQPNQDLILTKSAAISSASILAKSFPDYTKKNLGEKTYKTLEDSFYQTSIISELKVLKAKPNLFQKITAMHDVTEGGSLGAIYELCEASKVGVSVNVKKIIINKEQEKICNLFQIPPLRSTGAGSLLIACEKKASTFIIKELQKHHISSAIIGKTLPLDEGKWIIDSKGKKELNYWDKDPYWEAFFTGIKKGFK